MRQGGKGREIASIAKFGVPGLSNYTQLSDYENLQSLVAIALGN